MEVLAFFIIGALYFLPTIVAFSRSHHNKLAICALNTLLGLTVLGWIGAFVWACTATVKKTPEAVGSVRETRAF